MAEASMTVSKISDLTSLDVGKRYRVQTDDGAYIEGTIMSLTHHIPLRSTAIVQTHIEFDELYILNEKRQRVHYSFLTWGNRDAVAVEEW